jgi:hypothetical protein
MYKQILVSNNKTKTMWTIIKTETNRAGKTEDFFVLVAVMMKVMTIKIFLITSTFFFLSIAEKMILNIKNSNNHKDTNPITYHNYLPIYYHIKFRKTSTQEIEKIINSLNTKN